MLRCSGVHGLVKIALTAGNSQNFRQRVMQRDDSRLGYNPYLDATATSVWGDGSAGSRVFMTTAPSLARDGKGCCVWSSTRGRTRAPGAIATMCRSC
jgi:spore coat protein U-like protein